MTETGNVVWQRACDKDELADGEMLRVDVAPPVAVYRVGEDFFATAATCTHMDSCLTEGYLDGDVVECSLHMARFCVRTGRALSLPATVPLMTFPVRIVSTEIQVGVPAAPETGRT
jgi:nitrite reductase/ring-hydroxylating ferredoxin subunit